MAAPSLQRLKQAVRTKALARLSDDAIVRNLAKRLNRADDDGARLLEQLVGLMHRNVAARLSEQQAPVRELDYSRYAIKLVVSSPRIGKRLGSVAKEPFMVDWIERTINQGDVFYDIGANVGAYALIAAKATGNQARIFAFEPSASSFHDLTRNVFINDCAESVAPLPLALWSRSGLFSLELSSLAAGAARHRVRAAPRSENGLVQPILAFRLDDLVDRFGLPVPTHAKIDVDGSELDVLRGAEQTLGREEWRSVIVELDPDDTPRNRAIVGLLNEHGFGPGHMHQRDRVAPDVYWSFQREAARTRA
jgi:FkbM family methyltransferase